MSENDETENENANESEEKLAHALAAPAAPCPPRAPTTNVAFRKPKPKKQARQARPQLKIWFAKKYKARKTNPQ